MSHLPALATNLFRLLRPLWSAPPQARCSSAAHSPTDLLEARVLLAGLNTAPDGEEFQVNTETLGDQEQSAVALNDAGESIIVWASLFQDGSGYGIYGQRYNAQGVLLGSEFRVNTTTAGNQSRPAVALAEDGSFVVVWESRSQGAEAVDIYGQRFDTRGVQVGAEFVANTTTAGNQTDPDIGIAEDGSFVVVWTSAGQDGEAGAVVAQQFGTSGTKVGGEIAVNTTTFGDQSAPSIAVSGDGSFVVVWQSENVSGGVGYDVVMRSFAADGIALSSETLVGTTLIGDQTRPDVARLDDGWTVVVWESGPIGSRSIVVRHFASDGTPHDQQVIAATEGLDRFAPAVGIDADRNAVVAWTEFDPRSGLSQHATTVLYYDADAPARFFREGEVRSAGSGISSVAVNSAGWSLTSWTTVGRDGSGAGVYAVSTRHPISGSIPIETGEVFRTYANPSGDQRWAATASSANGRSVVVWTDVASGISYAQLYAADGTLSGGRITVRGVQTAVYDLAVAMDDTGNFVIAWSRENGGNSDIYVRRFAADGTGLGDGFVVNTFTTGTQARPSIAMSEDGHFVVAWESENQAGGSSGYDIYARHFAPDGTSLASEFLVNIVTSGDQREAEIAMNRDGNFMIVWEGRDQTGATTLYGRRFASDGASGGSEFVVSSTGSGPHASPAIAARTDGGFVVVWQSPDIRRGGTGVFARLYSATGAVVGPELLVNGRAAATRTEPAVAGTVDGGFIVTWQSENAAGGVDEIFARQYFLGEGTFGREVLVGAYPSGDQERPAVSSTGTGAILIAWESDGRDGDRGGVYIQRYLDLSLEDGEFQVNMTTLDHQHDPAIAVNASGETIVVWTDDETHNIRGRIYRPDGTPLGDEFLIDSNSFPRPARFFPTVAIADDGTFAAAWMQSTPPDVAGQWDVYTRLFAADGTPLGDEFSVGNGPEEWTERTPTIAMTPTGGFAVTWEGWSPEQEGRGMFVRSFNSAGVPLGDHVRVTQQGELAAAPSIGVDGQGNIVVTWESNGLDGHAMGVFARHLTPDGTPAGDAFQVNTYIQRSQFAPAVDVNDDGTSVIVWTSVLQDGDGFGIYGQRYAADGRPMGGEFRVNTFLTGTQEAADVAVAPDGSFVVTWQSEDQDGSETGVYARHYSASGAPLGNEFLVNSHTTDAQEAPVVAVDADGGYVFAWQSLRQDGSGNGVFARRIMLSADPIPNDLVMTDGSTFIAGASDGTSFTQTEYFAGLGSEYGPMQYGDFDGNGFDDAAALHSDGTWDLWLNDGETFQAAPDWATWSSTETWLQIVSGDFNGDGLDDVAARQSNGQWRVGISDGTQFTDSIWGGLTTSNGRTWTDIQIADFNGDGMDDIAARLFDPNNAVNSGSWWVQLSSGVAFSTTRWGKWSTNATWEGIRVGDFDGDGDADLVGRTAAGTLWVNVSDGTTFNVAAWGALDGSQTWQNVRVGDFNGDGLDDVLSQTSTGWWHVATSTGSGFAVSTWSRWSTAVMWDAIVVGDFNGDGRDDLGGLTSTGNWWVGLSHVDRFRTSHWGHWSLTATPSNVGVGQFA